MTAYCSSGKPIEVLSELFERLCACDGGTVLVSADEIRRWPREAVMAMKKQRLIVKGRPAASAICPGCEHECVMPVHTVSTREGTGVPHLSYVTSEAT